jgi:hypothetical protein
MLQALGDHAPSPSRDGAHPVSQRHAFLDHGLLVEQRPVLRTLISRHIPEVWEEAFPELAGAAATDD